MIIDSKPPAFSNHKQAEFEKAMSWATNNAAVVAICWPTCKAARVYLAVPGALLSPCVEHHERYIVCILAKRQT